MTTFRSLSLAILGICLTALACLAADYEQGEKLFNDPFLGGGITGKTCYTCHAAGEGIDPDFEHKAKYSVMGLEMHTLSEVINNCIEITLRGEGLDPDGPEMKALIAYIRILKKTAGR